MALNYYPKTCEILLCDYGTSIIPPEMNKRRPVVVISPRIRRRGALVTIIPLSTTAPNPQDSHHCQILLKLPLPPPFANPLMWAKCDMIATVSLARLDRFRLRSHGQSGTRKFVTGQLENDQIKAIRFGVLCGLGLSSLTIHI
jgi:mRNA interferase MazF